MNRSPRKWWQAATPAAKLRQIVGAVDIGLTRREAAILLGTTRACVGVFANAHGVQFADDLRGRPGPSIEKLMPEDTAALDHELAQSGAW